MVGPLLFLADIEDGDIAQVGGKALNLARMHRNGFSVPDAFVVPVSAYEHFLRDNSLDPVIEAIVEETDFGNSEIVNEASERIREIILTHPISEELSTSLTTACSSFQDATLFAVRSSAIAEDNDDASFAGQQDTFLNVRPMNVVHSARRCWAPYWTARAMTYRHDRRVDHTAIGIAVVVQSMVDAVSSGIMFTVDPISRKDQVVIEASWGLGESIASGIVILERLSGTRFGTFKKPVFKIVAKFAQTYMMFRENQRFYLDEQLFRARRLFLEYGRRLADQGQLDHQNDVFFLTKEEMFDMAEGRGGEMRSAVLSRIGEFEKYGDELPPKFLQGRMEFEDALTIIGDTARMTGTAASPGMVTGVVRMVRSIDELKTVEYGEILVATNTDPGWTAVFSKIGGLITETGGILSHGAVVSREYGIPAVTAVKGATKIFKSGQRITLNGNEGLIYISEG